MTQAGMPEETRRTLRDSLWVSSSIALGGLIVLTVLGQPRAGLALAVGLAAGSLNGPWVARSLKGELGFAFLSMGRLAVLTAVGVAVGFVLGAGLVWLTVLGLALAQLALAGAALRHLVAR
ncbi:MAG TPA: hypothetical protein VF134_06155 [Candidatus Dormibacteraeota bacterium]